MRAAQLALTSLLLVAPMLSAQPVSAQRSTNSKDHCADRTKVLGVSRVVEIDTSSGPLLGNQQYKNIDFLNEGEVVLTFDDGPLRKHTLKVLNALEAHCTKAIFFMVGRMAANDPDMVREIAKRGHTVGTHTWSHKNQGRLSRKSAVKEFELGQSAISLALGKPAAPFFRFPYLSDPNRSIKYIRSRGVGIFSIDVDSYDYRARSGSTVVNRILRGLKNRGKGITLFHDIQRATARGIVDMLSQLKRRGYKIVHLVPKERATTLAAYDKLAERELERRKKYSKGRPLASRSIVWPISSAGLPDAEELKPAIAPVSLRSSLGADPIDDEDLDLDNDRPSSKRARPSKPRKRRKSEPTSDEIFRRTFGQ